MPWLVLRYLPYCLLLLGLGAAWWRYTVVVDREEALEARAALLELNIRQQEQARAATHQSYLAAQAAQARLATTLDAQRARHRAQAAAIDEVTRHAEIRPWADMALPQPVRDILRAAAVAPSPAGDPTDATGP